MSNEEHKKTEVGTAFESAVAKMQQVGQAAAAEVKATASEIQTGVAKASKAVRGESDAMKARMKGIRRAAGARAKGVVADAQATVTKVRKAVKGAVKNALGKAKRATPRKAAARTKKPVAAKRAVSRKTARKPKR